MGKSMAAYLTFLALLGLADTTVSGAPSSSDKYYFHVRNYPADATPSWGDDDTLTNGVAHDSSNWYFTGGATDFIGRPDDAWIIWRIPVTEPLDQDFSGSTNPEVKYKRREDVPILDALRVNHLGDLAYHRHDSTGYLAIPVTAGEIVNGCENDANCPSGQSCACVPFEGCACSCAGDQQCVEGSHCVDIGFGRRACKLDASILFFNADTLDYIDYETIPDQTDVGWCAFDSSGELYTSPDDASVIRAFHIDWDAVVDTDRHGALSLTHEHPLVPIADTQLWSMQGGEFATNDSVLYVTSGIIDCFGSGQFVTDGLHALDASDKTNGAMWHEIQTATNRQPGPWGPPETGCFDYTFDNDGCGGQEPEGLTVWDFDQVSGHDSNVTGQLHVLLYDHNIFGSNTADLKHYTAFTCPAEISVHCTALGGTPGTDPTIVSFLAGVTAPSECATVTNDAPAFYPFGATAVTFTASDDGYVNVPCTSQVVVTDSPPTITCPPSTTIECGSQGGTHRDDPQLAVFFGGVSAQGNVCDPSPVVTNDAPALLPVGTTSVTFTATKASGTSASCATSLTVVDTTPPTIALSLDRTLLWPPNHKLVPITAFVAVQDVCDPDPLFALTSIASSEVDNGLGDGATDADIRDAAFGTADTRFSLRAERSGLGNGRTYSILYTAYDHSGNVSPTTERVMVSHSETKK